MSAATVPAVYASALLEIATERGERAQAVTDAAEVLAVLDGNPELLTGLASPAISREQGKQLLRSVFADKVCKSVADLLGLAVDRDRIEDLSDILTEVGTLAAIEDGRIEIEVTTAVTLDADNKKRLDLLIRERRGANAIINYTVDPAIIGGLRVQSDERVVDFTAVRHLAEMKRTMLLAPVAAAWEE
ncbi:MAG: ATP synthase F1 subunit delta [Planctomycetota bacterium]|jgi:F-type H+-transporting ATPase subunit delta|nr:ATP synthase F1 subunit delta [Planctomycetota bacterium]